MISIRRRSRGLLITGLTAMIVGALDPMEGSLVILLGAGLAALGIRAGGSRFHALATLAFVLVAIGVGALWGLSSVGGFGGASGRSNAWGLLLVPYPIGWILGLVAAIRRLREPATPPSSS